MKLLHFPIIRLTICLVVGILIGYLYPMHFKFAISIISFLLLTLSISFIIANKQFTKTVWFGVIAFTTMVFIGISTVSIHNQKNNPNHYTNSLSTQTDSLKTITFRIREVLKSGTYYNKYIVDILKIDDSNTSGKSILNIQKDSIQNTLKVDDVFITKSIFKKVIPPLNPGQFNYKNYLEKHYIYHQLFITNNTLLKLKSNQQTLFGIANKVRDYINQRLKTYSFKPDELAIINALLLGQRQNISEDVYTNYTNAGAIHILAISGLHIGIILIILNAIFKPLERLRYGHLIKTILAISILWSFAIIAGLSASVTRAVTMFSVLTIGMHLKRPTNIYNTLAISMLIILLFKPLFLFDVGFQLSYLAVFAIVSIDPFLYKLWRPKYWITRTYWHTFTITLSAQFGIIPISLYYFHQFPGLFFLSNLIIIPVLGFILGLGILVIILAVLQSLPAFLATFFGSVIDLMNNIIAWIAHKEEFIFKNISFSFLYVILAYILIITLVKFLLKKNYRRLVALCISVILFQTAFIYTNFNSPKNELLVFHKSRFSLLGQVHKNTIIVANNLDSITGFNTSIISDYMIENHIKNIQKDTIHSIYILGSKKFLIVDSLNVYNTKSFKPDYILLKDSPKINLKRLIDSIHPSYIIADGSNYKLYVQRWKSTCHKTKIPFHATAEKGAFIIDY